MFSSVNKRIFDLFVAKANANTQTYPNGDSVLFSGNFMFQFSQASNDNNFKIITKDADFLDFTEQKIVPIVDAQSIQIPFVEGNDRNDWEREFLVAIEIDRSTAVDGSLVIEFDETNPQYQAVLETIDTIKSTLTFIEDGYKYSFKIKQPTKVGVFKYNRLNYQILAITMNLTSMTKGYFGNETLVYLGTVEDTGFARTSDYLLDKIELNETMAKTPDDNTGVNSDEVAIAVTKRTWIADIVVNADINTAGLLVYKELKCLADLQQQYQVEFTNAQLNTDTGENLDQSFTVYITNARVSKVSNGVVQIAFKLERA